MKTDAIHFYLAALVLCAPWLPKPVAAVMGGVFFTLGLITQVAS